MKIGIMQPYFFPYLGYFQLIKSVDKFVLYDDIQYTKKGWINRNRILQNGKDTYITLSLVKDSDYLDIVERKISEGFDKKKLLNQIKEAYRKAKSFNEVFPLVERIVNFEDNNLFNYIYYSIQQVCDYLSIDTEFIVSSGLGKSIRVLKGQDKVVAICKELEATQYINSIGGVELYSKTDFTENGITLNFIKMESVEYKQFNNPFIPFLSIIDVMMFNSPEEIHQMLDNYELL